MIDLKNTINELENEYRRVDDLIKKEVNANLLGKYKLYQNKLCEDINSINKCIEITKNPYWKK